MATNAFDLVAFFVHVVYFEHRFMSVSGIW